MAIDFCGPLAVLLLATTGLATDGPMTTTLVSTQPEDQESVELVEKIRRKLVEGNYDYEPDSDGMMPMRRLAEEEYYDTYEEDRGSGSRDNADEDEVEQDSLQMHSAYIVANAQNVTEKANDVAEYAENVAEDAENVTEDAENLTEDAENVAEDAENVAEDAENVAEVAEYVTEDVQGVSPGAGSPQLRANQEEDRRPDEQPISKKDLWYYMDDERLQHLGSEFDDTNEDSEVAPGPKYKVLKALPNRRRSDQQVPQLIQEEDADGVAILNVGDGPVPEIRLPSNRRQYMDQLGDASDTDMADGGANPLADTASDPPKLDQRGPSRRVDYSVQEFE